MQARMAHGWGARGYAREARQGGTRGPLSPEPGVDGDVSILSQTVAGISIQLCTQLQVNEPMCTHYCVHNGIGMV